MYEEDHAPVTLSEIYHQAASFQFNRRAGAGDRCLAIRDSQIETFHPSLFAHIGQLLAYWRAAARNLNPDAPRHLARTVLLNA